MNRNTRSFLIYITSCIIVLFGLAWFIYNYSNDDRVNVERILDRKEEFHVKVQCWGEEKNRWIVLFTNDNWFSQRTINNAFDISSQGLGIYVVNQLELFYSEHSAVEFAKGFKTYSQCVQYNDSVDNSYNKLLAFRRANPPPPKLSIREEPKVCKDIIIR